MLASMAACLLVSVLLSLVVVVFSWTTIVMISPMLTPRLSANIDFESLRQRDCGSAAYGSNATVNPPTMATRWKLKRDENGLFIDDLATDVAARLSIAHANDLAGRAVFERFDLHTDTKGAVLDQGVGGLSSADYRTRFD